MRWIAQNAGEEGNMVVAKVRDLEPEVGFNAQSHKYENLIEAGVIDPTKVVRFAIQNAASIAALMLTTEAIVAEIPEKKKEPAMPPGGGMEDY
jgi:chaperonin GroEL